LKIILYDFAERVLVNSLLVVESNEKLNENLEDENNLGQVIDSFTTVVVPNGHVHMCARCDISRLGAGVGAHRSVSLVWAGSHLTEHIDFKRSMSPTSGAPPEERNKDRNRTEKVQLA
jgi:hypothetical protein